MPPTAPSTVFRIPGRIPANDLNINQIGNYMRSVYQNLAMTHGASVASARLKQKVAYRDILGREGLLRRRQEQLSNLSDQIAQYYGEFGSVLNDRALEFLNKQAQINVPTFTSILAGFENARASRADMEQKRLKELERLMNLDAGLQQERIALRKEQMDAQNMVAQTALDAQSKMSAGQMDAAYKGLQALSHSGTGVDFNGGSYVSAPYQQQPRIPGLGGYGGSAGAKAAAEAETLRGIIKDEKKAATETLAEKATGTPTQKSEPMKGDVMNEVFPTGNDLADKLKSRTGSIADFVRRGKPGFSGDTFQQDLADLRTYFRGNPDKLRIMDEYVPGFSERLNSDGITLAQLDADIRDAWDKSAEVRRSAAFPDLPTQDTTKATTTPSTQLSNERETSSSWLGKLGPLGAAAGTVIDTVNTIIGSDEKREQQQKDENKNPTSSIIDVFSPNAAYASEATGLTPEQRAAANVAANTGGLTVGQQNARAFTREMQRAFEEAQKPAQSEQPVESQQPQQPQQPSRMQQMQRIMNIGEPMSNVYYPTDEEFAAFDATVPFENGQWAAVGGTPDTVTGTPSSAEEQYALNKQREGAMLNGSGNVNTMSSTTTSVPSNERVGQNDIYPYGATKEEWDLLGEELRDEKSSHRLTNYEMQQRLLRIRTALRMAEDNRRLREQQERERQDSERRFPSTVAGQGATSTGILTQAQQEALGRQQRIEAGVPLPGDLGIIDQFGQALQSPETAQAYGPISDASSIPSYQPNTGYPFRNLGADTPQDTGEMYPTYPSTVAGQGATSTGILTQAQQEALGRQQRIEAGVPLPGDLGIVDQFKQALQSPETAQAYGPISDASSIPSYQPNTGYPFRNPGANTPSEDLSIVDQFRQALQSPETARAYGPISDASSIPSYQPNTGYPFRNIPALPPVQRVRVAPETSPEEQTQDIPALPPVQRVRVAPETTSEEQAQGGYSASAEELARMVGTPEYRAPAAPAAPAQPNYDEFYDDVNNQRSMRPFEPAQEQVQPQVQPQVQSQVQPETTYGDPWYNPDISGTIQVGTGAENTRVPMRVAAGRLPGDNRVVRLTDADGNFYDIPASMLGPAQSDGRFAQQQALRSGYDDWTVLNAQDRALRDANQLDINLIEDAFMRMYANNMATPGVGQWYPLPGNQWQNNFAPQYYPAQERQPGAISPEVKALMDAKMRALGGVLQSRINNGQNQNAPITKEEADGSGGQLQEGGVPSSLLKQYDDYIYQDEIAGQQLQASAGSGPRTMSDGNISPVNLNIPMSNNISAGGKAYWDGLHSYMKESLNLFADNFYRKYGIKPHFVNMHRNKQHQARLHAAYKSGKGGLAASAGNSYHQAGLAADLDWRGLKAAIDKNPRLRGMYGKTERDFHRWLDNELAQAGLGRPLQARDWPHVQPLINQRYHSRVNHNLLLRTRGNWDVGGAPFELRGGSSQNKKKITEGLSIDQMRQLLGGGGSFRQTQFANTGGSSVGQFWGAPEGDRARAIAYGRAKGRRITGWGTGPGQALPYDFRTLPRFNQLVNRTARENGINPQHVADFLNMIVNISAMGETGLGTYQIGTHDKKDKGTFGIRDVTFNEVKGKSKYYGRGIDPNLQRKFATARDVYDLSTEEQALLVLSAVSGFKGPYKRIMQRGAQAIASGDRNAIRGALLDYITTLHWAGGSINASIANVDRAIRGGAKWYGPSGRYFFEQRVAPMYTKRIDDYLNFVSRRR